MILLFLPDKALCVRTRSTVRPRGIVVNRVGAVPSQPAAAMESFIRIPVKCEQRIAGKKLRSLIKLKRQAKTIRFFFFFLYLIDRLANTCSRCRCHIACRSSGHLAAKPTLVPWIAKTSQKCQPVDRTGVYIETNVRCKCLIAG